MKTFKIDRLVSFAVIGICLVKAVLYGGSKPSYSGTGVSPVHADTEAQLRGTGVSPVHADTEAQLSGTGVSPVHADTEAQLSGTGVSPVHADTVAIPLERARCPFHLSAPASSQAEGETSAIHHSSFTLLTSWTARGAYSDWQRIDFPDGFAFPCGTNLLTGVTLMAWGELRCNDGALAVEPRQSATTGASSLRIVSLPSPVSLEPGASSVAYGLTASNSFVFAWQNACVNRDATNRIDAAIELFRSGAILITIQPTNQPTNQLTNYIPPRPPEGFFGSGQDNAWALAAFPADFAAITNKGYEAWLMEDKVGINEQNGLYKVSITVSSLPPDDVPCYLVCGPYKVVVNSPGTYSFPLEVFEHYEARTYPTAVPLTFEYDDGYRGEEAQSNLRQQSPPRQLLGVPLILPPVYDIFQEPRFAVTPNSVPLNEAPGTEVSLWCNVAGEIQCYCRSIWRTTKVIFRGSREAEVVEAIIADEVDFILLHAKGSCSATLSITPSPIPCCPDCCGDDCHCDGTCCACNCGCHSGGNSNTNAPPNVSQP